jgi:hypothetical protein
MQSHQKHHIIISQIAVDDSIALDFYQEQPNYRIIEYSPKEF